MNVYSIRVILPNFPPPNYAYKVAFYFASSKALVLATVFPALGSSVSYVIPLIVKTPAFPKVSITLAIFLLSLSIPEIVTVNDRKT